MSFRSRFFSRDEGMMLADDVAGLLSELDAQRARLRNAEMISKLRPEFLASAVGEGRGFAYFDASGPAAVEATLSSEDTKLLGSLGLRRFRNDATQKVATIESRMTRMARADMRAVVAELLAIMAAPSLHSPELRETAGYFLIERLAADAGEAIEERLADADANVRFQAAHVLRWRRSKTAVARLTAALRDSDNDVRSMACQALASQGDPGAVAALRELAESGDDARVQVEAERAIKALLSG